MTGNSGSRGVQAVLIAALVALSTTMTACGSDRTDRGGDTEEGTAANGAAPADVQQVEARSGAFTITLPTAYEDFGISDQPEVIEIGQVHADKDLDQVILSRYDGGETAIDEGIYAVTGQVASFGLDCETHEDWHGAAMAWQCTGEYEGTKFEKLFAAVSGPGQSVLLLVQGSPDEAALLARQIIGSLDWS
ncbi:hypothetical protein ACQBAT_06235 [Ornithinimicrobium sp. Y1847]|uniref:hypothetical protein n=1 Tax=Ornithinimicrobium sp. Y1847 TaxID=3405419 RepID=UPI003B684E76